MLLDRLPPEVAQLVLENLDLADIKALRLVSRFYSTKCFNRRFWQCLSFPTTDLSEESLCRFRDFAAHPTLSRAASTLTILAVAPDVHPIDGVLSAERLLNQELANPEDSLWDNPKNGSWTHPEDRMWKCGHNQEWLRAQDTADLRSQVRAFHEFGRLASDARDEIQNRNERELEEDQEPVSPEVSMWACRNNLDWLEERKSERLERRTRTWHDFGRLVSAARQGNSTRNFAQLENFTRAFHGFGRFASGAKSGAKTGAKTAVSIMLLPFPVMRGVCGGVRYGRIRQRNQEPDSMQTARLNLEWLKARETAQIESLTCALRDFGQLDEVKLDAFVLYDDPYRVAPADGKRWHPLWEHASRVHAVTVAAIARSGVLLNKLNIHRDTIHCTIPSADITSQLEKMQDGNLSLSYTGIRSLALGISSKVATDPEVTELARGRAHGDQRWFLTEICRDKWGCFRQWPPNITDAFHSDNFRGIAQLLQTLPDLSVLDLRLYWTISYGSREYAAIMTIIAQQVCLPHLEAFSLAGFPATEEAILQFLQKHTAIKHLTLRHICLTAGSWARIFEFIEKMPDIKTLRLSNLWHRDDMRAGYQHPAWEEVPQDEDDSELRAEEFGNYGNYH